MATKAKSKSVPSKRRATTIHLRDPDVEALEALTRKVGGVSRHSVMMAAFRHGMKVLEAMSPEPLAVLILESRTTDFAT